MKTKRLLAGLAAVFLCPSARAQSSTAEAILAPHGLDRFPALYVRALDDFLVAEELYRKQEYDRCVERLDALWAEHPPGTDEWAGCRGDVAGLNFGSPPCYYALLMLTEAARFRAAGTDVRPRPVTLSVILVERSQGIEPANFDELERGEGRAVAHTLEPALLDDRHAVIHESLFLFREYMRAVTGGRLEVRTNFVRLRDLSVPVQASARPLRVAGLGAGAWERIWSAVPDDVKTETDWWWVLYPSHVPERHPAFESTEFITGGMGVGPDGGSPCFIVDDRWLTRKPPHLGRGPYAPEERRAYLPQWLQHEFFHHLFRVYPEFGLEKEGHQWFDRRTWPDDFAGRNEPDYYRAAMDGRLRHADPPMHVHLRYAAPDAAVLRKLTIGALVGEYRHRPEENDWHRGTIERAGTRSGKPILRWRNAAGISWQLLPDLENGVLRAGSDNPYFESDPVGGRAFRLVLKRGDDGEFRPDVTGFRFQGGFYSLVRPE